MGATLSSRAEWTSATDKGGKLDFSKANEAVLLDILGYVQALCSDHPREATVLFKRPFVWSSSLNLEKLSKLPSGEYISRYVCVCVLICFWVLVCIIWNTNAFAVDLILYPLQEWKGERLTLQFQK